MTYNFEIDTVWCLEELLKAHRISERDKLRYKQPAINNR